MSSFQAVMEFHIKQEQVQNIHMTAVETAYVTQEINLKRRRALQCNNTTWFQPLLCRSFFAVK